MTNLEVIKQADEMRPNAIDDSLKNIWIKGLARKISDAMEEEFEDFDFPEEVELPMPTEDSMVYVFYLNAMIDNMNQEYTEYANDYALANNTYQEDMASYRRANLPKKETRISL